MIDEIQGDPWVEHILILYLCTEAGYDGVWYARDRLNSNLRAHFQIPLLDPGVILDQVGGRILRQNVIGQTFSRKIIEAWSRYINLFLALLIFAYLINHFLKFWFEFCMTFFHNNYTKEYFYEEN